MPDEDGYLPQGTTDGPRFYEASTDEHACGALGCRQPASCGIEWDTGDTSVGCDMHAALARSSYRDRVRRVWSWEPEEPPR